MPTNITPEPFIPAEEPQKPVLSRSQVLDQYWPTFFAIQLQEYEKRKKSGWGVSKGLFAESEFWEWLIANRPEVIKEMLQENEQ